jgi:hypothetical protein
MIGAGGVIVGFMVGWWGLSPGWTGFACWFVLWGGVEVGWFCGVWFSVLEGGGGCEFFCRVGGVFGGCFDTGVFYGGFGLFASLFIIVFYIYFC